MNVINVNRGIALVQWQDEDEMYRRGYVPEEVLTEDGNLKDPALISLADPYGLDFEEIIGGIIGQLKPEQFANELHRVGIWTYKDLEMQPGKALAAIKTVYGLDLAVLMRTARNISQEVNNG